MVLKAIGLYWAIIEMLRNEATYKLPLHKNTYRAIKMQTGTTIDVEKYLNDCINEYTDTESGNGLFNSDKKSFWSASLLRRMEKYETLKEKRSQAANARWNKEKEKDKKQQKNAKKCKCIKGVYKSNANAYKKTYKCKANLKKLYAKKCKLNQIKSNEIKLNKIKINSIYPSNHNNVENGNLLDGMMDEMDKTIFQNILTNAEVTLLEPGLCVEVIEILKELYMTPNSREKIRNINSKHLFFALKNFSVANTKSKIQKPKQYFKQCILSALDQTELSTQYDTDTIMDQIANNEGG